MSDQGFAAPPPVGDPAPPPPAPAAAPPRARRRRRRGVAWAWVIGGVTAVAIVGGIVADLSFEAQARALEPAQRGDTGRLRSIQVVAGLCLAGAPRDADTVGGVTAVPCAEPHTMEAIAERRFADDEWPGEAAVAARSLEACAAQVARIVPSDLASGTSWRVWAPSRATWEAGDRTAVCVVVSDRPLIGSVEAGTAAPA